MFLNVLFSIFNRLNKYSNEYVEIAISFAVSSLISVSDVMLQSGINTERLITIADIIPDDNSFVVIVIMLNIVDSASIINRKIIS